uniref:RNase H type-1 domain-containing protein n=1 Tax=Chenopodium quinoa TaxID=63459 RepID=A0A803MTA4_CHEQI
MKSNDSSTEVQSREQELDHQSPVVKPSVEVNDYGAWMLVKKPPPRKRTLRQEKQPTVKEKAPPGKIQNEEQSQRVDHGGSRFLILNEQNQEIEEPNKGNEVNLGKDDSNLTESYVETVDLSKFSQPINIVSKDNSVKIGKNNLSSSSQGFAQQLSRQEKDFRKQDNFFSQKISYKIKLMKSAHKVINDPELEDVRYWKGAKAWGFSVKYAMQLINDDDLVTKDPKWELAWKTPLHQRIRVFLWLLFHNRMLCNANKKFRHLTNDPRCKRCELNSDETLLHLLRDCPATKSIWASIGSTTLYSSFFTGNFSAWLIRNLKGGELIHSEKWQTCFATALWCIWRWRNSIMFGNSKDIPSDMGSFIRIQSDTTWNAMSGSANVVGLSGNATASRKKVLIRWNAPPLDYFFLNTDGAAKGSPGFAGGGGIIRDCCGNFIKCFTANFGVCGAYRAELLAAEIGLQMALNMGISKLS